MMLYSVAIASGNGLTDNLPAVPEWLTPGEAAKYLKVDRTTIYRWCDAGLVRFYALRSGRGRRFKREDLDALLKGGAPREGDQDGEATRTR